MYCFRAVGFGPDLGGSCILYQPLSHLFGTLNLARSIAVGAEVIIMAKFDLEQYLELIAKYKVGLCQDDILKVLIIV